MKTINYIPTKTTFQIDKTKQFDDNFVQSVTDIVKNLDQGLGSCSLTATGENKLITFKTTEGSCLAFLYNKINENSSKISFKEIKMNNKVVGYDVTPKSSPTPTTIEPTTTVDDETPAWASVLKNKYGVSTSNQQNLTTSFSYGDKKTLKEELTRIKKLMNK